MQKRILLLLSLLGFCSLALFAKGTLSGTIIANQADIHYQLGGVDHNLSSNADSFVVDQIIDLLISWQDSVPIEVGAGDSDRVLTFLLTNQGNGYDTIGLTYEHNVSSSDFLPTNAQIHMDSDGNGIYDPAVDLPVSGDLNISADGNVTLFVVADIPDNANMSDSSLDGILALSRGAETAGADTPDQVDTVVRSGSSRAEGEYRVRDYWLASHKSVTVHSDDNQTHTGTRLTYAIELYIDGNSTGKTIDQVVLTDKIPVGTAYRTGSLSLNGTGLTDAVDSDVGSFDGSEVKVDVGTVTDTDRPKIEFEVEVE